ncbi:MAG: hypothetical protein H6R18_2880 [Proteobacteria bacterium]|nr:hypothetical protein [Pseudomonadota bacterium]
MLSGVANLFGSKTDHPLADPKEFRRILSELPIDNAFKALDEVAGWFESLQNAPNFPEDILFDVVRQLEDTALPHVRRLSRDYLQAPRLSKTEENRMWTMVHGFWTLTAANYERCLQRASTESKDKIAERLQPSLTLLSVRHIAALAAVLKWEQFRYKPSRGEVWQAMGRAYLLAEANKYSDKAQMRYPNAASTTSIAREYLKALVFHASSMESLLPIEIELAERLIAHFLPGFVFSASSTEESVYWVNPAKPEPPVRLVRIPTSAPFLRFLHPGNALKEAEALLHELERGSEIPANIDLGGHYQSRTLLPVLRHLCGYWNKIPPQRKHERHYVKHRMSVLHGLVNAFVVFSSEFGARPPGLPIESWVVENVSRGGFGAIVSDLRSDWLKVGALVALQPDGGDNWLIGIVRRYYRQSDTEARAGIEALAHVAISIELKRHSISSYAAVTGTPALWLQDGNEPGETRLVMPPASFDIRESLEFTHEGQRHLLTPVALAEHTQDYELARYRLLIAE